MARSHANWPGPLSAPVLLLQGFGILELATVRLEEAETVPRGSRLRKQEATGTPGTTSYLDGARQAPRIEGIE